MASNSQTIPRQSSGPGSYSLRSLFRLLRCRDTLLRIGHQCVEAWGAVERLETRVFLHIECVRWLQPVIECLSQERQRFGVTSLERRHPSEVVGSLGRLRNFGPAHSAPDVERLTYQLLRLGVAPFFKQNIRQVAHHCECARILPALYAAGNVHCIEKCFGGLGRGIFFVHVQPLKKQLGRVVGVYHAQIYCGGRRAVARRV